MLSDNVLKMLANLLEVSESDIFVHSSNTMLSISNKQKQITVQYAIDTDNNTVSYDCWDSITGNKKPEHSEYVAYAHSLVIPILYALTPLIKQYLKELKEKQELECKTSAELVYDYLMDWRNKEFRNKMLDALNGFYAFDGLGHRRKQTKLDGIKTICSYFPDLSLAQANFAYEYIEEKTK